MSIKMNKFLFAILVLLYSVYGAKQISELECDKTSVFEVDERSLHPYLMEIIRFKSKYEILKLCSGTLISENFVLTDYYCLAFEEYRSSNIRVRKSKLIGEQYSNKHLFRINRLVRNVLDEIVLIEIYGSVRSNLNTSVFQPACLWIQQILPSTNVYTFHEFESLLRIESGNILLDDECIEMFPEMNATLHLCVNLTGLFTTQNLGSPIVIQIMKRNYIIGIVTEFVIKNCVSILLAVKVSSSIWWIQASIWPSYSDLTTQSVCGERKISHIPLISYGQPTYPGEFPWHVALFRVDGGRQHGNKYICGGTIIDYQTILTTAHCVVDERGVLPPYRFIIVAGTNDLQVYSRGTQNYGINIIKIHEEFNQEYMENDIALLKLNGPIIFSNYIQPICLKHNLDFGINITTVGIVTGWGNDEFDQPSDVLTQATTPIHHHTVCRKSDREFYHIFLNDGNFCAGYQNGTNVCSGDSGSAMIVQYKSKWYIRGIVSTAAALQNSGKCNINHTVLFTDVPKFYNWILNNL